MNNYTKYKPYPQIDIKDRTWPNKTITKAPIWCSVDLRDGNQALEIPMSLDEKLEFFDFLIKLGFKEIEIGFPAASDTEFEFTRKLITENLIPPDVTVQVLTQSRPHIIEKTFESLKGIDHAIVHLYNSTSTLQRDVVFESGKEEIKALAVSGAKQFLVEMAKYPETKFTFEYSPESFTGTEMDYAAEVCNAVIDVWKPTQDNKVIINLPSTVELSTPNIYADEIEYMLRRLNRRDSVILSLHTHNDRGTAVAAAELALMAGADRVEGTLFGNGERTGNSDIITLALNLFSQGVDPELNFEQINEIIDMYERNTRMQVHPRHPYAGELVYTAFSGSHQDAIRKGMERMKSHPSIWAVPYLPMDPMDVGRSYDPIVRINSQSGKGGLAFVLEQNYGLHLPKAFQQNFSTLITKISDESHTDVSPEVILDVFIKEYVDIKTPLSLISYRECSLDNENIAVEAEIKLNSTPYTIYGEGNGVIDAFCHGLEKFLNKTMEIVDYREHSMEYGTKARAISYIQIADDKGGMYFGAGTSQNILKSSLLAIVSAANKMLA